MTGLTIQDPAKFYNAINSAKIVPGDTIYMRGGTYRGNYTVNVAGTAEAPIIIRPYENEPVIIDMDSGFTISRPYVHLMDVEITDYNTDRYSPTSGVTMNYPGCWLIGCKIHHNHTSGVNWMGSGVGGIAECWIYENGYTLTDGSRHGHDIYTHNNLGGERQIVRNLLGNSWGDYSIHIYSGGANWLQDYICQNNVINGDPVHIGGGLGVKNLTYAENVQYGDYIQSRYSQANYDGTISGNLFINVSDFVIDPAFQSLVEKDNAVWGASQTWSRQTGYTIENAPASWQRFVPFSLSARWAGIQATLTDGMFSAVIVSK